MSSSFMDTLRTLISRCVAILSRRKQDADLDDELRAHVDMAIEENIQRGLTAEAARTAALRSLGGVTQTRDRYRAQRGFPILQQFFRDLRFALRQLRRSPAFALTAILTLALAIGGVTSIFSVVNTVLLKPFAFRDPDRLVVMREVEAEIKSERSSIPDNYRHYLRLKRDAKSIEDAAIFQEASFSVSLSGDHPHIVGGLTSSPNLFNVLGVQPILGRGFVEGDAKSGQDKVVVLSYSGWRSLLGGDAKVLGQTLTLGGEAVTVIGVLPPDIHFPQIAMAPGIAMGPPREVMIFAPHVPSDWDLHKDTGAYNYQVIARLKQGVPLKQASAELDTLQRAYTISAHLPTHLGISVIPLSKDVASGISGALWLIFAAVCGVLLIACVNLANLQLARAIAAERETAVCAALGASAGRLVMARLAESLAIAFAGGSAGVAIAFGGVRLMLSLVPANVPRLHEVAINLPVLLFAAGLSIFSAVAFGLLPALHSLRIHPQAALQANPTRTGNTREGRRTRNLLVASQIACTIALLIVTSLALRSFSHLLRQDRGFDSSHLTLAQIDLFAPQYGDKVAKLKEVKLAFVDRALSGLRQLPGVQSVALTSAAPLTGQTWVDDLTRPDHPVPPGERPMINLRWINPDYLGTMQIPLIAGRNVSAADRANPNVALISERAAREAFPGENPIGKQISDIVPESDKTVTVIGVVADTRINGLKDTAAMVYMPYWAYTPWMLSFLVRSSEPSDALIPEVRQVIWSVDSQVAIPTLKSMDEQVNDSVATDRFQAIVLASFGASALLLAVLGIYGVLAYSVSLRRQEFGIRIALGSSKSALMRVVLLEAARPVLLGASGGLALSVVSLRLVRSLLYQTPVADPFSIGGSLLVLLVAAILAALIPARHAASIDPIRALRMD